MMPKEKPLWKGSAFRLCLLSAAVFLCLQLGLRRSCAPAEKAGADASRALPARGTEQRLGPARSSLKDKAEVHLAPGAGRPEVATASRRRVTYLRSSRRRSSEPACCPLQSLGSSRRKTEVPFEGSVELPGSFLHTLGKRMEKLDNSLFPSAHHLQEGRKWKQHILPQHSDYEIF